MPKTIDHRTNSGQRFSNDPLTKTTEKMKGDSKIMVKVQRRSSAITAAPKLDITTRTMNRGVSRQHHHRPLFSDMAKVSEEGVSVSVVTFIWVGFYVLV